eukprot:g37877.t1
MDQGLGAPGCSGPGAGSSWLRWAGDRELLVVMGPGPGAPGCGGPGAGSSCLWWARGRELLVVVGPGPGAPGCGGPGAGSSWLRGESESSTGPCINGPPVLRKGHQARN